MHYRAQLMVADGSTRFEPQAFASNLGKVIPLTSCDGKHVGSATIEDIEVVTELVSGRQKVMAVLSVDYPIDLKIETGDAIAEPQQKTGLTGLTKENNW